MENIVILGSNGTIGSSLVNLLSERHPSATIHAFARRCPENQQNNIIPGAIDYLSEASIRNAASQSSKRLPVDLVLVTTGILHDEDTHPEKSLKDLSAEKFEHLLTVNAIIPALLAKYFIPLLNKTRKSIFAALSARLGSISDNAIGGWYAYRSSKAALNMILKTAAIETARYNQHAIIAGLHPGTVDSPLSEPFQANVPAEQLFSADYAASQLLEVLQGLGPQSSGKCFAWDGKEIYP